jgi:hypothetical protein
MADGFQIEIDAEMAEQLKGAAEAAGLDPQAYVLDVLKSALAEDWTEDLRRLEEYDRTGIAYDAEPVLKDFERRVAEAAAKRG